jgi:hypothetical protein
VTGDLGNRIDSVFYLVRLVAVVPPKKVTFNPAYAGTKRKEKAMDKKVIDYDAVLRVFEGEMVNGCWLADLVDQITGSIYDIKAGGTIYDVNGEERNVDKQKAFDLALEQKTVAFAIAITLMTMSEIDQSQTEALEAIEAIKKLIRESGVLPFLPKENPSILTCLNSK